MINLIIYRPPIVKYFKDRTELAKSTLVSTRTVLSFVSPRAAAGPNSRGREVGRPPSQKIIWLTSLTVGGRMKLYILQLFEIFIFFNLSYEFTIMRMRTASHVFTSEMNKTLRRGISWLVCPHGVNIPYETYSQQHILTKWCPREISWALDHPMSSRQSCLARMVKIMTRTRPYT